MSLDQAYKMGHVTRIHTGVMEPTKLERRKDPVARRGGDPDLPELTGGVDLPAQCLAIRRLGLRELLQHLVVQILLLEQLAKRLHRIRTIRVGSENVSGHARWRKEQAGAVNPEPPNQ